MVELNMPEYFLHLKRGSVYQKIIEAEVQISTELKEGDTIVIYRSNEGKNYAREKNEFYDGRFELVEAAAGEEFLVPYMRPDPDIDWRRHIVDVLAHNLTVYNTAIIGWEQAAEKILKMPWIEAELRRQQTYLHDRSEIQRLEKRIAELEKERKSLLKLIARRLRGFLFTKHRAKQHNDIRKTLHEVEAKAGGRR